MVKTIAHTTLVISFLMALSACVTTIEGGYQAKSDNEQVDAYVQLGFGYLQENQPIRARMAFQKALDINAQSAEALDGVGVTYQLDGEFEQSELFFQKSLSIKPDYSRAKNNYASLLFKQERYQEAFIQLNEAANDPEYEKRAQAYRNLGKCALKLNKTKQAEQAFLRALAFNDQKSDALIELADIYFARQNYKNAKAFYDRYIVETRQTPRSLWLGIRIEKIFNNRSTQASYASRLKNQFPDSEEYKLYRKSFGL